MDQSLIRIIAGALCLVLLIVIIMRRKSKGTKVEDDF